MISNSCAACSSNSRTIAISLRHGMPTSSCARAPEVRAALKLASPLIATIRAAAAAAEVRPS